MSDVFISYARSTEDQAAKVEKSLRSEGFAVWRDAELPAHRSYSDVIEERLRSAKAVVVLWSPDAARSHWVRAEADWAREAGTLVQASVDGSVAPMPFNQIQCADLADWDGGGDHPGWRKLLASVAALAGPGDAVSKPAAQKPRGLSVCVLPFANMSGDLEQEYFSDGISEDITTDLSKVSALGVVARNTAFTFKGKAVNVCDVARSLGVTHVLEGSVRKSGDRLRITAQLIDGESGDHVWADRFDRDLEDVFAIQDEISKAIVAALKLKLLPEEKKAIEQRGTTNVEAYKLYLLARQFWLTGNHGDHRREERVMRICGRVVQIDSRYADAWALLAIAQSSLHYNYGMGLDDGFAAAHTALSIDPTIAEAHLPAIRRLEEQGRTDDAWTMMGKAVALGPDSWQVQKEAGRLSLIRRDIERATRHFERAVEIQETDFHAWALLLTCYRSLDDKARVKIAARAMVAEAEKALQQDPSNGAALGMIAGGFAALGERERAFEWIDRAILIDPDNLKMRYNFACAIATHLGDKQGALRLLQRCLGSANDQLRVLILRYAESDPDFDCLRDDPEFQSLLESARRTPVDPVVVEAPASPAAG